MGDKADLFLTDEAATLRLGAALAKSLPDNLERACILLHGRLGSGKTTLARGLTAALEGADQAEVASPSFNLVNVYPTRPPVAHVDLYRLDGGCLDASLEDVFDPFAQTGRQIALVEWAERLPEALRPAERLDIFWQEAQAGRQVTLTASGDTSKRWLSAALHTFKKSELP